LHPFEIRDRQAGGLRRVHDVHYSGSSHRKQVIGRSQTFLKQRFEGSSYPGPAEVDNDLVVRSRFVVDSREGVLRQGAEFLKAREAGLIDDNHIVAEIGQILAGEIEGRRSAEEITVYKSLGHIVQDLATAWALYSGCP